VPAAVQLTKDGRKGINALTHIGDADAQQDKGREYKENDQPKVGHANDKSPA
jgi:hypothetical protein